MFKQGKVVEPEKYDENVDIETESDTIYDVEIEETSIFPTRCF